MRRRTSTFGWPPTRTAIDLAAEQTPDLIFLDLNLSDASGEDLVRSLRADPATRTVPAVVVSGAIPPAAAAAELGVIEFLVKPFQPDDPCTLVGRVLANGS